MKSPRPDVLDTSPLVLPWDHPRPAARRPLAVVAEGAMPPLAETLGRSWRDTDYLAAFGVLVARLADRDEPFAAVWAKSANQLLRVVLDPRPEESFGSWAERCAASPKARWHAGDGGAEVLLGRLDQGSFWRSAWPDPPFDVALLVDAKSGAFRLELAADLARKSSAARWAERWTTLLGSIGADPQRPLASLEVLGEAERALLLAGYAPPAAKERAPTLPERLATWIAATPETPAIVDGERTLRYGELGRRATALAARLREAGAGPERGVALWLPRGLEGLEAMVGTLAADSFFLPLATTTPPERLAAMLAACPCACALGVGQRPAALPAELPWLALEARTASADDASWPTPDGDQLAYVIFTSGSTGVPKAVGGRHGALANLVADLDERLPTWPGARHLWVASPAFDVSIGEVFGALARGATLVVGSELAKLDARAYCAEFARLRLHYGEVPAPFLGEFANLLDQGAAADYADLAWLTVGTEAIAEALLQRVMARLPRVRVVNFYGPTETTVECTVHEVQRRPGAVIGGPTPIGRPQRRTRVYVVDRRGRLAPFGQVGELWVGGDCLSRGYLGRPGATAEKFVPDPFGVAGAEGTRTPLPPIEEGQSPSGSPELEKEKAASGYGERLYRTGDLVRWLASGVLEFVGRIDDQLKVRGFRIEPGEIESALLGHEAVRQATVLAEQTPDGGARVVAYLGLRAEAAKPAVADLRRFLSARLPDYMVPSRFVLLEALPLTANGKVDKRALAALPQPAAVAAGDLPDDPLAQGLGAIWAEVLGLAEAPGLDQDFFELGGYSLLPPRLIRRVREELGLELGLAEFFADPRLCALLDTLRRRARSGEATPLPAAADDPTAPAPLTFAQERLWLIRQRQPELAAYNIPLLFELQGPLDREALREALGWLAERHPALRTRFAEALGKPVQVVDAAAPAIEERAAATLDEAYQQAQAAIDAPFRLESGPLWRALLLDRGPGLAWLVLVFDHTIYDGGSDAILLHDLAAAYAALRQGRRPELGPAGDLENVARRQRSIAGRLEPELAYWRSELAGQAEPFGLATRTRPAERRYLGRRRSLEIDAAKAESWRAFAHGRRASLFMLLLAAFWAALGRFAGKRDVAVATPVDGRTADDAGTLGMFVNTLVLRGRLRGNPAFAELLDQARRATLGALAHQTLPFEKVVEALAPSLESGRLPFTAIAFQLLRGDHLALELEGVEARPLEPLRLPAHFDLELMVVEKADGGLLAHFTDGEELFEAALVERLATAWRLMLDRALEEPDTRLAQLPTQSEAERRRVLVDFNATATSYPRDAGLAALFVRQAAERPRSPALADGDRALSYRELDLLTNRFAHALIEAGVRPGDRVPIYMERSLEMVVAMLGVLKAGAICAPLDPSHPADRIAFMVQDLEARLLVVHGKKPEPAIELPIFDFDEEALRRQSAEPLPPLSGAADLACLFFTSGSTGRPKGVQVTQRGIARLVLNTNYCDFRADDVVSQVSNASFDAASWEIWGAFLHGAALQVIRQDDVLHFERLPALFERFGVTVSFFTTSLFHQIATDQPDAFAGHRLICFGGEKCDPAKVALARRSSPALLVNGYGPTEVTTFAAAQVVQRLPEPADDIPIGPLIANTTGYVLDAWDQPTPIGVAGELLLGGDGLSLGYWRRPGLSAEKFVPNPFADASRAGERLYRTGDLARFLEDGTLEYLGRIDQQVKIRGFRIELGEIQAALATEPAVKDALVVARPDGRGHLRLVAYLVPHEGAELPSRADLQQTLRRSLPDFMVPGAYVALGSLPLTPNGKVDLRALPEPGDDEAALRRGARTPREAALLAIWQELLGDTALGIDDNFFEFGGHSLLATRLLARVRQALTVELPLRAIFLHPTVAALAEALGDEPAQAEALPPLARREEGEPRVLSFAQERMLFLAAWEGLSSAYNLPVAWRLRGPLDAERLRDAVVAVTGRHEILRSTFSSLDADARLLAQPEGALDWQVVEAAEGELEAIFTAEAERPFDLRRDLPLRLRLIRLPGDEHVLLATFHHIAADGFSLVVFARELDAAWRGEALPPLAADYADFAAWQRRYLGGGALDEQLAFWREQLAGAPSLLELPTDLPRPARLGHRGGRALLELDAGLAGRARALGQAHGATEFMVALAAFEVLLARLGNQRDLVVGVPVANRRLHELEALVGFFVNTLALRTRLGAHWSFAEILAEVKARALAAFAHQDLPFEKLVEALQPERNPAHHPLFQVSFQWIPNMTGLRLGGLESEELPIDAVAAKFDMEWLLVERPSSGPHQHGGGWSIEVIYNRELFRGATIDEWLLCYREILTAVVERPELRLPEIPLLGAERRRAVLARGNDTFTVFPRDVGLAELFARAVSRHGDAVALVDGARCLIYRELDRRTNQLARLLGERGVRPGMAVGLLVERSLELIVGILAIVKAGGAYAPLDPSYPAERLAFMLDDLAAPLLLVRGKTPPGLDVPTLDLADPAIAATSDEALPFFADSQFPAYVLFTSGSTGRPKGVAIPQIAVQRLVLATNFHDFRADDGMAQASNASFDAATMEIWGALLHGARLVVVRREVLLAPPALTAYCREHGVSVAFFTTSYFHQLAQEAPELMAQLRAVVFGGERCDPVWVRHARGLTEAALVNGYGPTECTTFAAYKRVEYVAPEAVSVPIGRALANTELYVVDRNLQPVPEGMPGELLIGGEGLALYYWRRPALTAEKFIPHPFSSRPGARLYRSGDLVRRLPDGDLDYLGRLDHQVKIRGFRIELGEVEAAIARHPRVADRLVVTGRDAAGTVRLIAYYTPRPGEEPIGPAELRTFLKADLPDPMVPAVLMPLEAFPLNANGKIDRGALPAPGAAEEKAARGPRTPVEELVRDLFAELLARGDIGLDDNFFELGGHSLLATRLVARLRQLLGRELTLPDFFAAPTVAGVVLALSRGAGSAPPPRRRLAGEAPALSFAQERMLFLHAWDRTSDAYNMPIAWRLRGPLDAGALAEALGMLVERQEVLRTRFTRADAAGLPALAPASLFALEVHERGGVPESEVLAELRSAGLRPFDLVLELPFRAALYRLSDSESLLLLACHHIAADGWSFEVIGRELDRSYQAIREKREVDLPTPPISYADYAAWQRQWLQGEELERQLDFWRRELEGMPDRLELPADFPRPPQLSAAGAALELRLEPELRARVGELCRRHGVTEFMALLALLQVLLGRLSRQRDFGVGVPIANRRQAEVENLVGFFVNTLVLRAELDPRQSVAELLGQVRRRALEAFTHQDLPFEKLVEALQPERNPSHHPLFQVSFQWAGAELAPRAIGDLAVEALPPIGIAAKFDLEWSVEAEADGALRVIAEYSPDLFAAATVQRWLATYRQLLEAAVAAPELALDELPVLTAEDRALLASFAATAPVYAATVPEVGPSDLLHQLFERQADRTPDAIALFHGDEAWTYARLDARANAWARRLRGLGVGPERLVALCAERGARLIVAMLAVQKAGGAYVPLDPAYPGERLAGTLEDSRAELLLSERPLEAVLPARRPLTLWLDADPLAERLSGARLPIPANESATADDLAYLIYTSGSTGRPKGVAITHANAVAMVAWSLRRFSPEELAVTLASTSICFDLSVYETYVPLACGGALALAENALALPRLPARDRVTLINTVPSALRELLRQGDLPPAVRTVNLAGEALPRDLVEAIYRQPGVEKVYNLYGPSEDTTYSTWSRTRPGETPKIGVPLDGSRVYLLDARLRPLPIGVPGELWMAGVGISRGYYGRPGLTAERFLPDPSSPEPGARMYRTGDLARWEQGGELAYLGRLDHQVKVRGFRIELGEVEAALAGHPAIKERVVVAAPDPMGGQRLVAYYSLKGGVEQPTPDALRQALLRVLPAYMVPSLFVELDALPLTPNGKIDRKALPAPDLAPAPSGEARLEGALETAVGEIWAQVLGRTRLDRHDQFFDLGGHSIAATRVIAALGDQLGVDLPLPLLFRVPQLAEFVAALRAELEKTSHGRAALQAFAELDALDEHERSALIG